MIRLRLVARGAWTIYALAEGSRCWALDYIDNLEEPDKKKIVALLGHAAEFGPPRNREKFRQIEGKMMEFKSYQDRLFCFFDGQHVIVLTHGVQKKSERHAPADTKRAEHLRQAYLDSR